MPMASVLAFLLAVSISFAQDSKPDLAKGPERPDTMTAEAIMTRVAENQDRSEELRKQYVYRQHTHISSHKTNLRDRKNFFTLLGLIRCAPLISRWLIPKSRANRFLFPLSEPAMCCQFNCGT
jgi:hypothetical protein